MIHGAKSTTTGQSLFGGQSSDNTSDRQFNPNEDPDKSNKQKQNYQAKPDNFTINTSGREKSMSSKYTLKTKQKAIFEALSSFDINKLKSILQRIELADSLNLPDLFDDDGHNLLHRAAYDNTFRISEYLIMYYKQRLA